jgi:hypothetical protein
MTGDPGAKGAPHPPADERAQQQDVLGLGERERDALLAWVGENLTLVRRTASGQRALYWIFGIALVAGLAAHVGGFLLESSATTEPPKLVADLLYQLGLALWTGVVVVVFVEIWPEAKGVSTSGPSMPTRRRRTVRPGPAVARPRTRRTLGTNDLSSPSAGEVTPCSAMEIAWAPVENTPSKLAPCTRVHFPADRNAFCK